jgi:hypothetical protein
MNPLNPVDVPAVDVNKVRSLSWADPKLYTTELLVIKVGGGIAVAIMAKCCVIVANIPLMPSASTSQRLLSWPRVFLDRVFFKWYHVPSLVLFSYIYGRQ